MKILYYNAFILYNPNLIYKKEKINAISVLRKFNFIKEHITDDYIDMFAQSNFFYNKSAFLIDRTNANPFYITSLADKIPSEKNDTGLSFKELCLKRADELLSKGKRINIMWSGGIDSTLVLFCLMNRANDLSQLRVILTPDSILESGNMFDKLIKNKISFILNEKVGKKQYFNKKEFNNFNSNDEIITTGVVSDNLNSLLRLKFPLDEKLWHLNYEDVLIQFTNSNVLVIDFLNKSVKAFPKQIKTYIDFLKFYGFNFHWHKAKYKDLCGLDQKYFNSFDDYFCTEDFQRWSIWNKESNIIPNVLKLPQRNLIYELTDDKQYAYKKEKTMNGPTVFTNNDWLFLTEKGETIYSSYFFDKYLESIK